MTTFALTCLGAFTFSIDNQPITHFPTDKVQALLTYLVLEPRPHRREALASLLWPDIGDEYALKNLRSTLHRLRQTLDSGAAGAADTLLLTNRQTVELAAAPLNVDALAVERGVLACEQHAHTTLAQCDACLSNLAQVVTLYQGELLAGFGLADAPAFEEWLVLRREHLHHHLLRVLGTLVDAYTSRGELETAHTYAAHQLAVDPYREDVHRRVMRLLAQRGLTHQALAHYAICCRLLREELGIEPDAETTALYEQIRAGKLDKVTNDKVTEDPAVTLSSPHLVTTAPRHNLPATLPTLIGREQQINAIKSLLVDARLVTLTGGGGVGKTSLALQVATALVAEYGDGVWLVELARLHDPSLLPSTIAAVIGVGETKKTKIHDTLLSYLQPKQLLLVLDNCEHLIDACAELCASLLAACPQLKILTTSRKPLHVRGEKRWLVPSLATPTSQPATVELLQYDAIRLLVERMSEMLPTFTITEQNAASILQICQRLDGNPLALELAAARSRLLSPQEIATRLDQRFALLTKGRSTDDARHQSLRATIDWGYELLSAAEQRLFRQLAVFAGGFSMAAVEAIYAEDAFDLLDELLDKSFVMSEQENDSRRFRLLETLREYALEKLMATGELAATRQRHLDFFLDLAEEAAHHFQRSSQGEWFSRLDRDHDNLRAALAWALALPSEQIALPLRLANALSRFWEVRGYLLEGTQALKNVLAASEFLVDSPHPATRWRTNVLRWAGSFARIQSDFAQAKSYCQQSLALAQALPLPAAIAYALNSLGLVCDDLGEFNDAHDYYQASYEHFLALGDQWGVAITLNNLASIANAQENPTQARPLSEESVALMRIVGDRRQLANLLATLAEVTQKQGDYATAQHALDEALHIHQSIGDRLRTATVLSTLADLHLARQDGPTAYPLFAESLQLAYAGWDRRRIAVALEGVAQCAASLGDPQRAVRLWSVAATLRQTIGSPLSPIQKNAQEAALATTRQTLGDTEFTLAWDAGRLLPLAQACREAVELEAHSDKVTDDKVTSDKRTEHAPWAPASGREAPLSPPPLVPLSIVHDWGDMPAVDFFAGRTTEMAQLKAWLTPNTDNTSGHARLVSIVGIGGMGKTTLAAAAVKAVAPLFDAVIWRSLLNAPPLTEILHNWLQLLTHQSLTTFPDTLDEQLRLLLGSLRQQRCLLVLDNVESILQAVDSQGRAGEMRPGYESYAQLLQRLAGSEHQSSLLLTSREQPYALARQGRPGQEIAGPVQLLRLTGLPLPAGYAILQSNGLHASSQEAELLVQNYSGNPLALQIVATTIADFFGGDIAAFQQEEGFLFDGIRTVLDQQFARLSDLEREILVWLAIEREAVTVPTLRSNLVHAPSTAELLGALHALQARSLLEKNDAGLTLQNVIIEYTTEYLVVQVCQEIAGSAADSALRGALWVSHSVLNRFALLKAQAKEYVRQSQERLILQPILDHLLRKLDKARLVEKLQQLIVVLRSQQDAARGYAGGNLLNLLLHLGVDISGYDFSNLAIWQADLRENGLLNVNLAHADLTGSTFVKPFNSIWSITYSPDGQLLAGGSLEGSIFLWQAANGQLVDVYRSHSGVVYSLAFSPDNMLLASGGQDQTIRVWDLRSGQTRFVLRDHTNFVNAVAFSADGALLASGSDDRTVRLWDARTGQAVTVFADHRARVTSVAFAADSKTLASCANDQTIRLWDLARGASFQTLHEPANPNAITFDSQGGRIVSVGSTPTVRFWQANSGACYETAAMHQQAAEAVAFSPNYALVASGSRDHTVRLWDAQTYTPLRVLHGHRDEVLGIAFSPDGQRLASTSNDRTVCQWDVQTGALLQVFNGFSGRVDALGFDPADELVVFTCQNGQVRLWQARSGASLGILDEAPGLYRPLALCPDHPLLIGRGEANMATIWDWQQKRQLWKLEGHTGSISAVAAAPGGRRFATGSRDETVRIWDAHTRQVEHVLSGQSVIIWTLAFSPDAALLAAGSDSDILLWETRHGGLLHKLEGHTLTCESLAFHQDSALLASGSQDHTIRLWRVDTGRQLHLLRGHGGTVNALAFSPDGRLLASVSGDMHLCIWDVEQGILLHKVAGHHSWVLKVAFLTDGNTVATGSYDGSVKLWDVRTGACLETLYAKGPYANMNIRLCLKSFLTRRWSRCKVKDCVTGVGA